MAGRTGRSPRRGRMGAAACGSARTGEAGALVRSSRREKSDLDESRGGEPELSTGHGADSAPAPQDKPTSETGTHAAPAGCPRATKPSMLNSLRIRNYRLFAIGQA